MLAEEETVNATTTDGSVPPRPVAKQSDPLYRIYVYNGNRFDTRDGTSYMRLTDGSLRLVKPKARGKSARRAEKMARRK